MADAGYSSTANLEWAAEFTTTHATGFFIAPGRPRRDDPPPVAPRGRIPDGATAKQRMVFGQMANLQNAKQLPLRGLDQARGEWLLLAACHNLRKLHGHIGITGLAALPAS